MASDDGAAVLAVVEISAATADRVGRDLFWVMVGRGTPPPEDEVITEESSTCRAEPLCHPAVEISASKM